MRGAHLRNALVAGQHVVDHGVVFSPFQAGAPPRSADAQGLIFAIVSASTSIATDNYLGRARIGNILRSATSSPREQKLTRTLGDK